MHCASRKIIEYLYMVEKDTFCKEFLQNVKDFPGSFPEAVVRRFSVKEVSWEFRKIHSLFSIKLEYSSLQFYLKKRLRPRRFPVNFAKFLRTFYYRTLLGNCLVFHYFKRGLSLRISFCRFYIKTLLKKIFMDIYAMPAAKK